MIGKFDSFLKFLWQVDLPPEKAEKILRILINWRLQAEMSVDLTDIFFLNCEKALSAAKRAKQIRDTGECL